MFCAQAARNIRKQQIDTANSLLHHVRDSNDTHGVEYAEPMDTDMVHVRGAHVPDVHMQDVSHNVGISNGASAAVDMDVGTLGALISQRLEPTVDGQICATRTKPSKATSMLRGWAQRRQRNRKLKPKWIFCSHRPMPLHIVRWQHAATTSVRTGLISASPVRNFADNLAHRILVPSRSSKDL